MFHIVTEAIIAFTYALLGGLLFTGAIVLAYLLMQAATYRWTARLAAHLALFVTAWTRYLAIDVAVPWLTRRMPWRSRARELGYYLSDNYGVQWSCRLSAVVGLDCYACIDHCLRINGIAPDEWREAAETEISRPAVTYLLDALFPEGEATVLCGGRKVNPKPDTALTASRREEPYCCKVCS